MTDSLPPFETIMFEGLAIRMMRGGASSGTPIILTSPWPESIYAFRFIWPKLANLGPLIAIDLPGFGLSDPAAAALSPSGMGDFLVRFLDALKIEKCHAIGPDVGTAAFLFAAVQAPDLFATITVGSGGTDMDLVGDRLRDIIEGPASALDLGADAAPVVEVIRALMKSEPPADVLEDYRLASADGRYAEAATYVRAYPRDLPRLQDLASTITAPVLVLSGKNDPLVPTANGDLLESILPTCRHEILDAGHFVWEDAPDAYARHVSDWISGISRNA